MFLQENHKSERSQDVGAVSDGAPIEAERRRDNPKQPPSIALGYLQINIENGRAEAVFAITTIFGKGTLHVVT